MVVAPHPVLLRPPLLIERTEQNFVQGLYRDLKTPEGRQKLRDDALSAQGKGLRLKQPVHRAYNLLLLDAACDGYGYPRLDPRKIASAGVVVRRIVTDEKGQRISPQQLEGWVTEDRKQKGWISFDNPADLDHDPDPKFRRAPYASGHAEVNKRLVRLADRHFRIAEAASPAFVVPPDVCEASGRTLIYGGVSVTSIEVAEAEAVPKYSDEEMLAGFATPLTAGPQRNISAAAMPEFVLQVGAEYGAFGNEPEEKALFNVLNQLTMPGGSQRAGDFLKSTYSQIHDRKTPAQVSAAWPAISEAMARQLKAAVFAVKQKRLASFRPNTGRFEDPKALYRARMFVRIRNHPECPPELWWSEYTDPFQIAPWYEHSGPPVKILLPDINKDTVKNLKPNVAFQLPPGLFNLLANNTPDAFLKGEAQDTGVGLGIFWLCSFSLPIITLCAFIVLNIFLKLFNIVFFWMLYIKICIPIPIPKKKGG